MKSYGSCDWEGSWSFVRRGFARSLPGMYSVWSPSRAAAGQPRRKPTSVSHAPPAPAAPDAASTLADGGVSPAAIDVTGCHVVRTWPGMNQTVESKDDTWDGTRRLRTEIPSPSSTSGSSQRLEWRYGGAGEVLAYAGFGAGQFDNFQHDYRFDDRDNVVEFRFTYPPQPDVTQPSSAPLYMHTQNTNTYDARGRLVGSKSVSTEANALPSTDTVFHEDPAGRCDRIEIRGSGPGTVETRTYDDGGRLARVDVAPLTPPSNPTLCLPSVTLYDYDADGRVASIREWCGVEPTGAPGVITTYEYVADGSTRIESLDFAINDTPNDTIRIDGGAPQQVTHYIETQSAACSAITAAEGAPPDLRCRTD